MQAVRPIAGLFRVENRSVGTERAAASPREGPLLASAFASARLRAGLATEIDLAEVGGPQPGGGGGPQFVPELGVHSAGCGPNRNKYLCVSGKVS